MYRTSAGHAFEFSGWSLGESPLDHFDAGRWLECAHGVCLALSRHHDVNCAALAVEDDGLLHELIHLALGIDICTHTNTTELRGKVAALQNDAPKPNGAAGGSNPIRLVGSIPTGAANDH
jgi:hypothetical protein